MYEKLYNILIERYLDFALGQPHGEDIYTPQLVEALADGKIIIDLSCGSNDTIALVERDIIQISYNGQTSRLPVHSYPFVGHVIRKMANYHKKRVEDVFLVDSDNKQLSAGDSIRDIKVAGHKTLTLISKPSLYDYASSCLTFLPPDAERIRLGCDATPLVKGGTITKLIEWLTFPKPTGHEVSFTFTLWFITNILIISFYY